MDGYDFKGPEYAALQYIRRVTNGARPDSDIARALNNARRMPDSEQQFSFFRPDRQSLFIQADLSSDPVRYEVAMRREREW